MADLNIDVDIRRDAQGAAAVERDLEGIEGATRDVGDEATQSQGKFGGLFGGISAGAVASIGALASIGTVTAIADQAGDLQRLATIAQVSVDDFQLLANQVRLTGGDSEDLSDALREMQLRLAEATSLGTGPAHDALNILGISLEDINALDAPGQFALLRDAISGVEDPALRLFAADELLGGSAERLNGILSLNVQQYADLTEEAGNHLSATQDNVRAVNEARRRVSAYINDAIVIGINAFGSLTEAVGLTSQAINVLSEDVGVSRDIIEEYIATLSPEDTGFLGRVVEVTQGIQDWGLSLVGLGDDFTTNREAVFHTVEEYFRLQEQVRESEAAFLEMAIPLANAGDQFERDEPFVRKMGESLASVTNAVRQLNAELDDFDLEAALQIQRLAAVGGIEAAGFIDIEASSRVAARTAATGRGSAFEAQRIAGGFRDAAASDRTTGRPFIVNVDVGGRHVYSETVANVNEALLNGDINVLAGS